MKISEIEIDDSQTGYIWVQIFAANRKQAIALKHQILNDQAIRERLENQIKESKKIISNSSSEMEITVQNFLTEKLQLILDSKHR